MHRQVSQWTSPGKATGFCSTYQLFRGDKLSPQIGEINITRQAGIEILSHEIVHAALGWARRKRLKLDRETAGGLMSRYSPEELFCYAYSDMLTQAVRELNRRKIWS